MLVSKKPYKDFTVRLKFKAVKGNSGFYFRADKVDHAVGLHGFQARRLAKGLGLSGKAFKAGAPVLVNLVRCFMATDMDALVLGRHVLLKCDQAQSARIEPEAHLSQFAPD